MEDNIYSRDYVKNLFNQMSSSYEQMNYITSFGFSIRWRNQFLESIRKTDEAVEVIDLLTGMGEDWQAIKKRLPNSKLTALDFSDGMLKYAKQKCKHRFGNAITILQQDILENNLPSNYFDNVVCAFGLKTFNTEQLSILAQETKRILKTGGRFAFVEVSTPENSILKLLYGFYLGRIIPILGWMFLGNPEEYRMLWVYTSKFVNARNAAAVFTKTGLKTNFVSYFYGCASGVCGEKV
ncbi:MAG: ubiquinone biosynthesis protein [Sphingobacteriaceae bacterium]|jgi:demethylmenaquinone methyltransferase/2-methoxy-6-polyprenyl-1,4-benzoquinol methylase|nr:ubiquinone biosynthesis protein [Sphingobacteriaceae bacterium]